MFVAVITTKLVYTMKKRLLLIPVAALLGYFTLSSYSSGYVANRTGSDAGTVGCGGAGCHGAASSLPAVITLDSAGTIVTRYKPGKAYTIRMAAASIGMGLPKFGFQLSASKVSSPGTHAGTFGTIPSGASVSAMGADSIVGHTMAWTAADTLGGKAYRLSIPWVAPVAGTGSVTFKGVVNAVNGTGGADASDMYSAGSLTVTEITTSAVSSVEKAISASVSPNPVINELHLSFADNASYQVAVYNLSGALVCSCTALQSAVINTANWAAGSYQIVVSANGASQTYTVVKL